jgi:hypothetical protein
VKLTYDSPAITDYGSIAAHTFTRCGGPAGGPPKDSRDVPHHIDMFGECSALS